MSELENKDSKKHILAVDDTAVVLTRIFNTLQKDFEVTTVNSGSRALKYLEQGNPDLILLDINMPQKSGIDTLKEIRSMKKWENIPVIMLTGVEDRDMVVLTHKLGINDYILKPFDSDTLLERINRVLNEAN